MMKPQIIGEGAKRMMHFDYEELPVCGVGKSGTPILSMDEYRETKYDMKLHHECLRGLAMCGSMKQGMTMGSMIPEEEQELHIKGWTEIYRDIERYDPTGEHRKDIDFIMENAEEPRQALYSYFYFAFPCMIPWFFGLYLKHNAFFQKDKVDPGWTPEAKKFFPKVINYIETLPFEIIGRVLFFTTFPGQRVPVHRDAHVESHRDHNINLFFTGSRKSFVWDPINKNKIYLDPSARSYFFNNRDFHGVDPEPGFRYTLRVDGKFKPELCEQLGLVDGMTWTDKSI
ncbi:MAG: hypothetical protein VW270_30380 [Candidatus Poseidoniales archaeon]